MDDLVVTTLHVAEQLRLIGLDESLIKEVPGEAPRVPFWAVILFQTVGGYLGPNYAARIANAARTFLHRMQHEPDFRTKAIVVLGCVDRIDRYAVMFDLLFETPPACLHCGAPATNFAHVVNKHCTFCSHPLIRRAIA